MDVRRFSNPEQMSLAAADFVADRANAAVAERGVFTFALSGGRTPRPLYEMLAVREMPWSETHLFWGDERLVPPDHADSNYRMARDAMISKAPIPDKNVHRVRTELRGGAARAYEDEIRGFFRGGDPRFDLIVLGLGSDGHTASLFPGEPALHEKKRLVVAARAPEGAPSPERITFTLPLIDRVRCVLFLVSGGEKIKIVESIRCGASETTVYPAAMVRPTGDAVWFLAEEGR